MAPVTKLEHRKAVTTCNDVLFALAAYPDRDEAIEVLKAHIEQSRSSKLISEESRSMALALSEDAPIPPPPSVPPPATARLRLLP